MRGARQAPLLRRAASCMAAAEDDEQLRPTYFELAAADSLVPSLKAALSYSLSVRLAAACTHAPSNS